MAQISKDTQAKGREKNSIVKAWQGGEWHRIALEVPGADQQREGKGQKCDDPNREGDAWTAVRSKATELHIADKRRQSMSRMSYGMEFRGTAGRRHRAARHRSAKDMQRKPRICGG